MSLVDRKIKNVHLWCVLLLIEKISFVLLNIPSLHTIMLSMLKFEAQVFRVKRVKMRDRCLLFIDAWHALSPLLFDKILVSSVISRGGEDRFKIRKL